MRKLGLLAGFGATAMVIAAASCRDPTQITVEITTDVPCVGLPDDAGVSAPPEPGLFSKKGRVAVWLSDPTTPQAVARSCAQSGAQAKVGTIAIVPSGSPDERVNVTVAINAKDPTQSELCNQTSPSADCIVARRTVGFVPHTPLTLPIHLSLACTGVRCDKGFTCDNGQCVPDAVTCRDKTCVSTDAGAVDAKPTVDAQPCALGNAQNCLQCGFACAGKCVPSGCQLVTTNPLGAVAAEGCIGVTSGVVVWSAAKGGTGSVYWVLCEGTSWGTVEANVGVGPVAAASGFFTYQVRAPAAGGTSFVRDRTAAQPPTSVANSINALPSPGVHQWVARSSTARCTTTWSALQQAGIDCEKANFSASLPAYDHLAVGKSSYLATSAKGLSFGPAGTNSAGVDTDQTLTSPSSVAAVGASDDYVVVAQDGAYGLYKVSVDTSQTLPKIVAVGKPFYTQPGRITGIHVDGASVYFADESQRIAKVAHGGPATQVAEVVVPAIAGGLTTMRNHVCLDVDDVAVYYLVGGLPMRAPK